MWDLSKKKFAEVEEEAPAGAPVVETVGSLSDSEIESFLGEEDEETVSEPLSLEGEEQTKESMGTEEGVKAETEAQITEVCGKVTCRGFGLCSTNPNGTTSKGD